MEPLTAAGLGSGLDIKSLVDQLVAAERQAPTERLNLAEARVNREISSVGKVKAALAEFKDVLETLGDLKKFQQRQASVSDEGLLAVTAGSSAAPASYSVEVLALAERQKIASQSFADSATPLGYGSLTITADGEAVVIDISQELNTLADIRDAINGADTNPGVVASIVNAVDGARLILTGSDSGSAKSFSVVSSGGDGGLAVLDYSIGTPGTYTEIAAASDAAIKIDGFDVTSANNSVIGAIDDVTLELLEAEPGNTFTFEVSLNQQASRDILGSFVGAYNALAGTIRKETEFDAEKGLSGALLGDSLTRGIQDALRRELSAVVNDASLPFNTLAEIGIVTTSAGNLEIDAERLNDAFATDFDGLGRLFSEDGGIATKLLARVDTFLDSDGQIESREGRLRSRLDDLGGARERLDQRLESVRRRFELQFNAMDLFISQLNTTSQYLAQQLG